MGRPCFNVISIPATVWDQGGNGERASFGRQVRDALASPMAGVVRLRSAMKPESCWRRRRIKEAGWWLKDAPFLVMNVDILTDLDLSALIGDHFSTDPWLHWPSQAALPPVTSYSTTGRSYAAGEIRRPGRKEFPGRRTQPPFDQRPSAAYMSFLPGSFR